jgi:probable HAF family extracellular repeat protein
MQSLNLLLGVGNLGAAAGINNAGQIVGTASSRGFVVSGGLLYLGEEGTYSPAYAINNFGQVVGQTITPSGYHAFLGFALQDLLTLPGDIHSVAYGINDNGQVVGASYGGSLPQRAFLWSSGSMQDLGTLPNSTQFSATAYGISNTGQVVGENGGRAFLWTTTTGMQDIFLLREVTIADRWIGISSARAISNAGHIVGTGINRLGQIRAFLLTPIR